MPRIERYVKSRSWTDLPTDLSVVKPAGRETTDSKKAVSVTVERHNPFRNLCQCPFLLQKFLKAWWRIICHDIISFGNLMSEFLFTKKPFREFQSIFPCMTYSVSEISCESLFYDFNRSVNLSVFLATDNILEKSGSIFL
jgi:hypothetical protein